MSWSSELRFLFRGVRLPLRILGFRERPAKVVGKCVLLGKLSSGCEDWARFGRLGFLDCSQPEHRAAVPCDLQKPVLLLRLIPCFAAARFTLHKHITAYDQSCDSIQSQIRL